MRLVNYLESVEAAKYGRPLCRQKPILKNTKIETKSHVKIRLNVYLSEHEGYSFIWSIIKILNILILFIL